MGSRVSGDGNRRYQYQPNLGGGKKGIIKNQDWAS